MMRMMICRIYAHHVSSSCVALWQQHQDQPHDHVRSLRSTHIRRTQQVMEEGEEEENKSDEGSGNSSPPPAATTTW